MFSFIRTFYKLTLIILKLNHPSHQKQTNRTEDYTLQHSRIPQQASCTLTSARSRFSPKQADPWVSISPLPHHRRIDLKLSHPAPRAGLAISRTRPYRPAVNSQLNAAAEIGLDRGRVNQPLGLPRGFGAITPPGLFRGAVSPAAAKGRRAGALRRIVIARPHYLGGVHVSARAAIAQGRSGGARRAGTNPAARAPREKRPRRDARRSRFRGNAGEVIPAVGSGDYRRVSGYEAMAK